MSVTRFLSISTKNFKDLTAKSFHARIHGKIFQGFVVKKSGKYYAYQNLCQHLPITLDLRDGEFFNHEKTHLQCHMHGAVYEIENGECIAGPCVGARLIALPLEEEDGQVVIGIPEKFESP